MENSQCAKDTAVAHLVEDSVLRELPQISEVLVHVEPEEELAAKGIARVK
jgi:divalent metal cation (Fe/Co/Zn/Cd) transporter